MKRESFSYKVYVDLTLDRKEIEVLSRTAETHYDAKCRAASVPGPDAFLNAFRNVLDEDKGTATRTVDQREVDTMLKILEMSAHLPEDEAKIGMGLSLELRRVFFEMSDEWKRVNGGNR